MPCKQETWLKMIYKEDDLTEHPFLIPNTGASTMTLFPSKGCSKSGQSCFSASYSKNTKGKGK